MTGTPPAAPLRGRLRRWRKQGKRALRFALLAPLFLPLGCLPRSAARRLGAGYGDLARLCLRGERERAHRHLAQALPELPARERERIVRDSFASVGHLAVDFLRIGRGKGGELLAGLTVEGLDHLEATERSGRGTLLVTAHFGNWELLAVYLARRPRRFHVLYNPFEEERLGSFVRRVRERAGVRPLPADRPGPALRALRAGDLVGLLVDRVPREGGVVDEFFGRECRTATGVARLGLHTGALVLCAALWEDDSSGYRVRFWEPWDLGELPTGKGEAETSRVETVCRWSTKRTEEMVRMAPERWPWFYDRWKIRGLR